MSEQNGSVELLYGVREKIKAMRYSDGLSWRKIACSGEFNGLSHTTLRDIAHGHEPSVETCRRLGVNKDDRTRISADVTPEERERLHEIAAPHGGWSAYVRKIARGELDPAPIPAESS